MSVRTDFAPAFDTLQCALNGAGVSSVSEYAGWRAVTGYPDTAGFLPFCHQRDHIIHMRIRINVMQTHPHPSWDNCSHRPIMLVFTGRPSGNRCGFDISAIGRGIRGSPAVLHTGFANRALRASLSTSPTGRLSRSPRMDGIMQNGSGDYNLQKFSDTRNGRRGVSFTPVLRYRW